MVVHVSVRRLVAPNSLPLQVPLYWDAWDVMPYVNVRCCITQHVRLQSSV